MDGERAEVYDSNFDHVQILTAESLYSLLMDVSSHSVQVLAVTYGGASPLPDALAQEPESRTRNSRSARIANPRRHFAR